MSRLDSIF